MFWVFRQGYRHNALKNLYFLLWFKNGLRLPLCILNYDDFWHSNVQIQMHGWWVTLLTRVWVPFLIESLISGSLNHDGRSTDLRSFLIIIIIIIRVISFINIVTSTSQDSSPNQYLTLLVKFPLKLTRSVSIYRRECDDLCYGFCKEAELNVHCKLCFFLPSCWCSKSKRVRCLPTESSQTITWRWCWGRDLIFVGQNMEWRCQM